MAGIVAGARGFGGFQYQNNSVKSGISLRRHTIGIASHGGVGVYIFRCEYVLLVSMYLRSHYIVTIPGAVSPLISEGRWGPNGQKAVSHPD